MEILLYGLVLTQNFLVLVLGVRQHFVLVIEVLLDQLHFLVLHLGLSPQVGELLGQLLVLLLGLFVLHPDVIARLVNSINLGAEVVRYLLQRIELGEAGPEPSDHLVEVSRVCFCERVFCLNDDF